MSSLSAGRREAEESEEEGDDADDFFQFGERRADVILDGFGGYAQFLCDLLMGKPFVAAQAEDPLPLLRHLLHGHVDNHQQVLGGDLRRNVVRQKVLDVQEPLFVTGLHALVFEDVENGVLGHPEQIAAERFDAADRLAGFPDFQKDIVRQILGFAPVFQHAEGKRLHMRGVTHVQRIECIVTALPEALQDQFVRLLVHSFVVWSKIRVLSGCVNCKQGLKYINFSGNGIAIR